MHIIDDSIAPSDNRTTFLVFATSEHIDQVLTNPGPDIEVGAIHAQDKKGLLLQALIKVRICG